MQSDPTIDEIREMRRKISAEFGHDPRRHYLEYERQLEREGNYLFSEKPATGVGQDVRSGTPHDH